MNMKEAFKSLALGLTLLATAGAVNADETVTDAIAEMEQLRTQMRSAAPEERAELRQQLQQRAQTMSSEERSLFQEMNRSQRESGTEGSGNRYRYGQAGDSNQGKRYAYGQGQGNGSGNMYRYGQGGGRGRGGR
jgi:hypothetical protein